MSPKRFLIIGLFFGLASSPEVRAAGVLEEDPPTAEEMDQDSLPNPTPEAQPTVQPTPTPTPEPKVEPRRSSHRTLGNTRKVKKREHAL